VTLPDRNGVFWWGYVAVLAGAALFIAYSFVGVFVPMLVLALYAGIRTFQRRFEGDVVSLLLSRVVGFDVEGDGPVALLRDPPSVDQLTELLSGSALQEGLALLFAYLLGPVLFGWYGFFLIPIVLVLILPAVTS